MHTIDLVRETSPAINVAGNAFYFHPDSLTRGKDAGLDGFRLYVLGRGGVLGDVEPAVVSAAFGYFHPDLVAKIWNSAKAVMDPRAAARLYLDCAAELGRSKLAGVDDLDAFNAAAEAVVDGVDRGGLPLFAGIAAEPLPDDAPARAYRNIVNLRELRGSIHLACVLAEGLTTAVAHAIKRPDDVAMFGYDEAPAVTDADREALDRAEERTDAVMTMWLDVLDDDAKAALSAGTAAIAEALSA